MTTEFTVEWVGFTAQEQRNLRALWSQVAFPANRCREFPGKVIKGGGPDGSTILLIEPKDLRTHREHSSALLPFTSEEELVESLQTIIPQACEAIAHKRAART